MIEKKFSLLEKIKYFFIALVLAILIFFHVQNERNPYSKKVFELTPQLKLNSKKLKVISEIPPVKIVLGGKKDVMLSLRESDVRPFIVIDKNFNGKIKIPVRLLAPREVDLISLNPKYLNIEVAEIVSQNFNIEPVLIAPDAAFQKVKISKINPAVVTVSGEINSLKKIKNVIIVLKSTTLTTQFAASPLAINESGGIVKEVQIIPDTVVVESIASPFTSKLIPVKTILNGVPAEGFEIKSINIFPDKILVSAPSDKLSQLKELKTTDININGISSDLSIDVPLETLDEDFKVKENKVKVEIKVEKIQTSKNKPIQEKTNPPASENNSGQ